MLVFGSGKSGIGAAELLATGRGSSRSFMMEMQTSTKRAVVQKVPALQQVSSVYAGELPEEVQKSTGSGSAESRCTDGYPARKELL